MELKRAWNWTVDKVQQTQQDSDVILKDDLFKAFQVEHPDIPRDTFFSFFGRFMGNAPFDHVTPLKKKGKILGYRFLTFKNSEPIEKMADKKEASFKHDKHLSESEVPNKREKEMPLFKETNKRKLCQIVTDVGFANKPNKTSKMISSNSQKGNCISISSISQKGKYNEDVNLLKQTGGEKFSKCGSNINDTTKSCQDVGDVVLETGEVNVDVFDEPQNKKAKQIKSCSSQNRKASIRRASGSEEIGGKRLSECDTNITIDTSGHQDVSDVSCVESGSYPEFGFGSSVVAGPDVVVNGDDVVDYGKSGGYSDSSDGPEVIDDGDFDDDMTDFSETSWNDPIDVEDELLADGLKGASFRKKDCESKFFNPSIFFSHWKNVRAFTSSKLPSYFPNHTSYLEQLFPEYLFQQNTALLNVIGSVSNACLTQIHSFLAASFLPVAVGPKAAHYVAPISMGTSFPQFSAASPSKLKFQCEICVPYQKWAQEHNVSSAKLKSKAATLEQIAKGTACLMFSGLRQLYEHAISKSHREAINFFLDETDGSVIEGTNLQQEEKKHPKKLQSNLTYFFPSSHSLN